MKPFTTLVSAAELLTLQQCGAPLRVFDCSFDLARPAAGREQYLQAHIPGAVHADLDHALSAGPGDTPASGGRHPLPSRERFAAWLADVGVSDFDQVVVYDRQGANFCGRLWWMLQWCGHGAVAVLDGGLQAWQALPGTTTASGDEPPHTAGTFTLRPPLRERVTADEVLAQLHHPAQTLLDARAGPRYRGEVEPLDPVAGHIPGALNRPFTENLGPDGRFKPAAQLRAEFETLLAGRAPATVTHQCGSGVSAIPNLLAMEIAGLGPTRLYAGSWSEWCRDPSRPVATGAAPG